MPRASMPGDLERIYGSLGFADRVLYSNFVSSLDGVVSLGATTSAGSVISGRNQADRFLMGLLRAFADAVLVGAGTVRATPGHRWTPQHIYPDVADAFQELRQMLGRKHDPRLVVLTATGDIDLSHPAIVDGATILTTRAGIEKLHGGPPTSCEVIEVGDDGHVDITRAVTELRDRGYATILTEGGPHVMGELTRHDLLDEAFLTISPVIAGRDTETRLAMVEGVELLPGHGLWTRLLTARRHGDFLFLRYAMRPA
ncbi:MAG TPA: dihydrofolate reductase family protein [Candidatus Dormibacteraeota bacterium]|nr:dihydrofolate reductase family protein [Candidatus Dormibacteraeota bacterium]